MTLSTTPHTITSGSPTYTLASGNTLQTTGIAVTNAYNGSLSPQVVNSGTIRETGINNSANDVAIFLVTGTAGTTSIVNNSTGLISGSAYAVVIGGGNSSTLNNRATITNFGTIYQSGDAGNSDSAVKFSTNTGGAVINSGLLSGSNGGVYFKTVDAASLTVINNVGGTITNNGSGGRAVTFNDFNGSTGNIAGSSATFYNAGIVKGLVEFDVANGGATATNAGTITGQIISTGGGGTLTLDAGEKLTGGAAFNSGGTLDFAAGTVAIGTINTSGAYTGFNSATILSGADFNIGSAASASSIAGVTSIGDLGTLNIAGSLTNTTINMEGSLGGSAVVDFTGTSTSTPLTNYGANDQIVISTLAIAPGSGASYKDSYNTATGVLTINELNSLGSIIGTANVTVSGTNPLSSTSFVNVSGPGGDTVVLGSSAIVNSGSIYIDNGEQVTLAPTAGVDTDPVTFGVNGSPAALNILDLNSNPPLSGSVPLTGPVSGFGLGDAIIIGPSLAAFTPGDQILTNYTSGGEFEVEDLTKSSPGTFVGAGITFAPGGNYSAGSFVELFGTNGLYLETPATVAEQGFTFSTSGTGNFDNPADFTGGVAPGQNIYAGEDVSIVAGTASISATMPVTDNGTIIVTGSGAGLIDSAPLSGAGTIVIAGGGQVTLANSTGTDTGTVYFGTGGTSTNPNLLDLTVPGTAGFSGTIANFGTFDTIILGSSVLPSSTPGSVISFSTVVSGGQETLTVTTTTNGTINTDNITFASPPPGVFSVTQGPQGIVISDMPCFAAGTRILTPDGQVQVEQLTVGDLVLTSNGAEQEIIWVGSRTIDLARHAMPEKVRPVRILAGAFGPGLPERDLRLSPDHALFIDGHLIEAKTLVNGVTVRHEDAVRHVTYHHIELAAHDVLLAEGLPAESYLESGNRLMFESDAAPMMLHPDFAALSRAKACAPLAVDGDVVIAARQALLARAASLGFAATADIDLVVYADGVALAPLTGLGAVMHFALPAGVAMLELVSSTGVPAELGADPSDRRVLGVAVSGLALIAGGARTEIAIDDAAHQGFHAAEPAHRWTNGRAVVALPPVAGGTVLEVSINGQAARWTRRAA
jgi:hypothetical protein